LAYGNEPLMYRILVIGEAAGLAGGIGAYLPRSLISERRLRYQTVESVRGRLRPRTIERDGPTGLLTTTTGLKLDMELETRILSIPIDDSREQTAAIVRAAAGHWDGTGAVAPIDPEPWHSLQEWLQSAEHRVVIPFARQLTDEIPPVAVRLRRHLGALMSLIATHALLHQAQRERNGDGRIIATLDDYGEVYRLVVDLTAEGVGASVSPQTRETVEAVQAIASDFGASLTVIAKRLGVDKSVVSRRVDKAIQRRLPVELGAACWCRSANRRQLGSAVARSAGSTSAAEAPRRTVAPLHGKWREGGRRAKRHVTGG
jgi:hypothetical protein